LCQARLRGGEASDQHPERTAGNVVQADACAELDRRRIAAVFAADTQLDVRPGAASLFARHLDQLTNTLLVELGKRILLQDAQFEVRRKDLVDVVTREAEGGLREIVGTEAE